MTLIKVIVIDDERSAREELKSALLPHQDFMLMAEAADAEAAKVLIEKHKPDLIFLDIQMPEKSGFDLLDDLAEVPLVIFTTAHHQFAIQAFEVNALDYLLKPIRAERFTKAIEKVRTMIGQQSDLSIGAQSKSLFIKDGEKRFFVSMQDIYLIESLENYTRLYFQDKKALQRRSLRQWEETLDPNIFFRINRTEIINTQFIHTVNKNSKGQLEIQLKTGELLEVSNRQAVKFRLLNGIHNL
jgi:two-component system, LytTR family, response regulator